MANATLTSCIMHPVIAVHKNEPVKLYGREKEIQMLLEAYERCKRITQEQHDAVESNHSTVISKDETHRLNHAPLSSPASVSKLLSSSSSPSAATASASASIPATATSGTTTNSTFSTPQELLLLCGASGTGKTALAQSLRHTVEVDDGGFFLMGKFDWTITRQDPYAVFVSAMTQFTTALLLLGRQQRQPLPPPSPSRREQDVDGVDNDDRQTGCDASNHKEAEEEEDKEEKKVSTTLPCNAYPCDWEENDNDQEEKDTVRPNHRHHNNPASSSSSKSLLSRLRHVLQDAVGSEGHVLTDHIPTLKHILQVPPYDSNAGGGSGHQDEDDANNDTNDDVDDDDDAVVVSRTSLSGTEALRRFQFVFCKFVRAIATVVPVVLFLDDLQWSDQASLDLLHALLTTTGSKSSSSDGEKDKVLPPAALLVVGAYRPPELPLTPTTSASSFRSPSNHCRTAVSSPFQEHLKSHWLGSKSTLSSSNHPNQQHLRITTILLSNLTEADVNDMVAATLQLSSESTAALAQVVHAKSSGNAFHALQYLKLLSYQHKQHHQHRRDSNQRESAPLKLHQAPHDDDDETVDDLVCRILQTLPPFTLEVLKVASCMKDEIDPTVMSLVLDDDKTTCDVAHALDLAVNEGVLSFYTPEQGRYHFIHDRIRHAAFSFVEHPDALSLDIGRKLCRRLCSIRLAASVFTVVNLLNKGVDLINDQQERYKVAELNLEAGVRAASLAAFPDAAQYLEMGITLCKGSKSWEEQYKLMLSLHNGAADAALCNQQYDRVREITHEVFQNAKSLRDKLPSYTTQINAAGQSGNVHEAMIMGFDVLKQLGEPFPSKPTTFVIVKDLIKTKVMIRGRSNDKLLSLKPMVDETKLAAIHIMNILIPYAVQSASPQLVLLGTRLIQVCLTFGLSKVCSVGFNTYGWVLCRHDRKQGYRFGKLALSIIEKLRAREMIPRVHSIFYFWNCHWMRPLRETLEPLRQAYRIGMDIGDTEYGLHAAMFRCFHSLFCGLPLPQVADMFLDTMSKLRHFKLEILLECTNVRFHLVKALMTSSTPGSTLSCNREDLQHFAEDEPDNKLIALLHYSCGATLAYSFGEMELAETLVAKRLALKFDLFAEFFYALDQFQHGLIAIARARSGVDRAGNIKTARKAMKMMAVWAKDCPFNFLNKKKLLEAELRSILSKKSACRKIHRLYGQAFQLASEQGLTHEAALACELAGDFMHRHDEQHLAFTYWEKSRALYLEWGATAKAANVQFRAQNKSDRQK